MSNRPSFSKYGKSFQEDLVHLILDDRPFADQILEVLDTNFLELEYLRLYVSCVCFGEILRSCVANVIFLTGFQPRLVLLIMLRLFVFVSFFVELLTFS